MPEDDNSAEFTRKFNKEYNSPQGFCNAFSEMKGMDQQEGRKREESGGLGLVVLGGFLGYCSYSWLVV